jgi:DNA polymerase V
MQADQNNVYSLNAKLANNPMAVTEVLVTPFCQITPSTDAQRLKLFASKVCAGFPSPADDYLQKVISLDDLFLKNPTASFMVQAKGNSMIGAGIADESFLLIDRSLEPKANDIVIASVNGEHTVKRLKKTDDGRILLCPENPEFSAIELTPDDDNIIWGVVISVINMIKR